MRWLRVRLLALALAALGPASLYSASLPPGFVETAVGGAWNEAVGLTFDAHGRLYVWEKGGRVWIVDNGVRQPEPLIDLSNEVGDWRDHGLDGFALDPDFLHNGYLYLLYVVDHNYLANFGTPNYDPSIKGYFRATIGRVTRYTARAADGFRSVDPDSRRILVGESISTGFPILDMSHGLDSLVFASDGTLFVASGDSSAFSTTDTGGWAGGGAYNRQGVAEGIIRPEEDVGAYRAQMVDSLAGKIIRIDPASGDGVPSNPYYQASNPRSARSRVWALGMRNPFRMTLRPGTGSDNRADGKPGVLYIGDVGWTTWEELDVAKGPANFGWPLYDGFEKQVKYYNTNTPNFYAPNPLFGNGCSQPFFFFGDLIHQEARPPDLSFPNPCDATQPIPASLPRFVHTRPAIDWNHDIGVLARAGTFDTNGQASVMDIGAPGSPVSGVQIHGTCSIGGVWYTGSDFPAHYQNTYFHADWGAKWIKNFSFDADNNPISVQDFLADGGGIVALATHPISGGLYYVRWGDTILKVSYLAGSNQPPQAVASLDKSYGLSPLTVQFTGSNSADPEGQPLTYLWNFGDGATSSEANPTHIFTAPAGVATPFPVTLTVTDSSNAICQATLLVAVNDTPPSVAITSPVNGSYYPMSTASVYQLTAVVSSAKQSSDSLSFAWEVVLHHNEHVHTEPVDTNHVTTAVISPVGCGSETYFYRIRLTVTDAAGLSATDEVGLYPNCQPPATPGDLTATAVSSSQIALHWTDHSLDEETFQIERTTDGTNYLHIATVGANVTNYVDMGLSPTTTFSYRVLAQNTMGVSAYSNLAEATTSPAAELPSPWRHSDIGSVGLPGSAGFSDGLFIVKASGADIWDVNDAFHFVYLTWTGDGTIVARVAGIGNTDTFAKAGLMFRETLDANSPHALQFIAWSGGLGFQSRTNTGGNTTYTAGSLMTTPYWLKLERVGQTFNGYASLDGTVWTLTGSDTIAMEHTIYVGLAVTAHNNSALNTATFDNVQVPLPAMTPSLTIDRLANGTLQIGVLGQIGSTYRTDVSTHPPFWTPLATNLNTSGSIQIIDPGNLPQRFYRATLVL